MFAATVTNFIISSLRTGAEVAYFIAFIREPLIVDIDYPLSEKRGVLRNMNLIILWAGGLAVSIKPSLPDPVSIEAWWRYCSAISLSFGGPGLSSQIDSR